MRRAARWILAAFLAAQGAGLAAALPAPSPPAGKAAGAAGRPKPAFVTLGIRHRVFHEFAERRRVRMNEEFQIGDTDYSGRVVAFVPDFTMDLKTRKITSRSDEPKNPAFRIFVREKGVPQDTAWAFLDLPPHFARTSMLSFQLLRVEFENRAPLISKADTTEAETP